MALVHHDGQRKLIDVAFLSTEKGDPSNKIAVSADYNHRYHDLYSQVCDFLDKVPDNERLLIGIEGFAYTPGAGRSLLNTAQAVGVIKAACFARGKIPFEFKPSQVKQKVLGKKSGSKQEVMDALIERYPNLPELLEPYAKGKWEHMTDAVGLVECAFEEYAQRKLYIGAMA